MDTVIAFTPSQILMLCSAVVLISSAVQVILNGFTKLSAPNKTQNQRLDDIEERLDKHEEYFKKDLLKFDYIDSSNRVTQRAILALLEHSIDGNEVNSLKKAKNELQDFLIDK